MLSPPITLHFKGEQQHSSYTSGILSIIVIALILASLIYYFLAYVNKESPKSYFFTRYIEDAGDFPINSKSMFNYVQFVDKYDNRKLGFDFNALVAVGSQRVYGDQYMGSPDDLDLDDYWIYGPCNSGSDVEGIKEIVNFTLLNNAACIRYYYDQKTSRYYETTESGFRWPMVSKGTSNPLSTFYGIIVQRCDKAPECIKDKIPTCKDEAYINEVISKISLKYQIIDHYADMLNYDMPFTKYFYEVTSAVANGIYIINHLNFNPANMITHNGILFDNIEEEDAYFFTQNEKHTYDENTMTPGATNGCLIGIYFWMQNTLQQYERQYDRFQDFLSNVGGISSIITTIAYYLNILVSYYMTILDTKELLLIREKENLENTEKKTPRRKPTIFKDIEQVEFPPRRQNDSQKKANQSNNVLNRSEESKYGDEEIDIYKMGGKSVKVKSKKDYKDKNASSQSVNVEEEKYEKNIKYKNDRKKKEKNDITIDEDSHKEDSQSNNNESVEEKSSESERREKYKKRKKKKDKKNQFNFFHYIWYLLSCSSNNKKIKYYEDIRETLISEENIIQNYWDISELLKLNGIPKKDVFRVKK